MCWRRSALPLAPDAIEAVRRELDAKDAGGLVAAGGEAYLPLLSAIGPFESAIERLAQLDAANTLGRGALSGRIAALRTIAARVSGEARLTLDPSERHGFEYQTWFGFTLYAEGIAGALGRGGSYRISGPGQGDQEAAIGFSLYPDRLIDQLAAREAPRDTLFLPLGHDTEAAARLRAIGWRTVAALASEDDPAALGCTHRLESGETLAVLTSVPCHSTPASRVPMMSASSHTLV